MSTKERKEDCSSSSDRRVLPPPPDRRLVVQKLLDREAQELEDLTAPDDEVSSTPKMIRSIERKLKANEHLFTQNQQSRAPSQDLRMVISKLRFDKEGRVTNSSTAKATIGPHNTTILGDYSVACFSNPDSKWLVQAFPKANINTLYNRVLSGEATVGRRYIFIMIGANQVFRAIRSETFKALKQLIVAIFSKNAPSKVFFAGVLPRPAHNAVAKPKIMEFNRLISTSIKKLKKHFPRLFYLPVQTHFHNEAEFDVLYNQDQVTLNEFGRLRLKRLLLEQAGFIRNQ